jgi:cytochrome P450
MEPLREALRDFLDLTTNPRVLLPVLMVGPDRVNLIPAFRRRVETVDRLIAAVIDERRRAEDLAEREDVLSMMLQARHEDGSPMSEAEIRDELLTLLVAGHETTATALSWAMERLTRHPEKLERLRAEVEAGDDAYLTATVQETLRLRPVIVVVVRKLTEAVELGGYELPAGARVVPSIHLIHRDPQIYPEPERFLPERFLDNPPGTYTWIPFGGGVRRCLCPIRDGRGPPRAGPPLRDHPGQPRLRAPLPPRHYRDAATRRRGHPQLGDGPICLRIGVLSAHRQFRVCVFGPSAVG